jgi:hypothetical protein
VDNAEAFVLRILRLSNNQKMHHDAESDSRAAPPLAPVRDAAADTADEADEAAEEEAEADTLNSAALELAAAAAAAVPAESPPNNETPAAPVLELAVPNAKLSVAASNPKALLILVLLVVDEPKENAEKAPPAPAPEPNIENALPVALTPALESKPAPKLAKSNAAPPPLPKLKWVTV